MPPAWIAAAGLAVGAVSSVAGGIASSNAASYQGAVATNNSIIQGQNATAALQAGNNNAFDMSLANAGAAGKLKAGQAANGINVNSGTAVNVQASQREVQQQNVGTSLANTARTAYGYRVGSMSDQAQAQLDSMNSENDLIGGVLGGVGKGASAAGQAPGVTDWLSSLGSDSTQSYVPGGGYNPNTGMSGSQ
jgi:hypothetical protein